MIADNERQEAEWDGRLDGLTEAEDIERVEADIQKLLADREELLMARAERYNEVVHIQFLLELMEQMSGKATAYVAPEDDDGSCADYDEFFKRTQGDLPEKVVCLGRLVNSLPLFEPELFNDLVIRHIATVTVLDDSCVVGFQAGVEIEVPMGGERESANYSCITARGLV